MPANALGFSAQWLSAWMALMIQRLRKAWVTGQNVLQGFFSTSHTEERTGERAQARRVRHDNPMVRLTDYI